MLTAVWASAQEAGGIAGRVRDAESNPLPGVAVTLSGDRVPTRYAVTGSEGTFRFSGLPAAYDYALELDFPGFKTLRRESLAVSFGRDVRLELVLTPLPPDEMITIVGHTPLIDKNDRRLGYGIDALRIMALPIVRDPWIVLAMAPGLVADRENIGGAESGLQAYIHGAGAVWTDAVWTLEGTDITDPSVPGDAPAYVDVSNYEEIRVDTAGGDVRTRTPGIQLHLVPRRGGAAPSGGIHFDMADKMFEMKNVPLALQAAGLGSPGINTIRLYGGHLGGEILRDRLWAAGSFGVQDVTKRLMTGGLDAAKIASGYARFDLKLSSTLALDALLAYDEKTASNRTRWGETQQAPETLWTQSGPSLTGKARLEKQLGALRLTLTGLLTSVDFHLRPVGGERTPGGSGNYQVQDFDPSFYVSGNANDYRRKSRQFSLGASGRAFFDHILGGGHEILFGVEMRTAAASLSDTIEGNLILQDYGYDWVEAVLLRDTAASYGYTRMSAYAQDTIDWGRLSLTLGLRFDRERALIRDQIVPASPWMPEYLAALNTPEYDPGFVGSVFSPRIGLSYDLRGDGRDVLRLSLAIYGSQAGMNPATFVNPASAGIGLLWKDADGNGRVAMNELWGFDWGTGELASAQDPSAWLYAWGFDPSNPGSLSPSNRLASNYAAPLTDEILLSYEKEILPDFGARLDLLYRKRHRLSYDVGILAGGLVEDASNWVLVGHNSTVDADYWARQEAAYGEYRAMADNSYEQYVGATFGLSKRYSHGWLLDGTFTYADWKISYGGDKLDPTNMGYLEDGPAATESQSADLLGVFIHARWTAKLTGMVRLPWGFNASAVFTAREGFIVPTYTLVERANIGPTLLYGRTGGGGKLGDTRLPALFLLNVRLEKVISIGDRVKVAVGADGFNILNASTSLKKAGRIEAADFLQDKLIVNPGLFRLGARISF